MEAPIDRLPVEIWQDILLLTIESDEYSLFATTSTFIHFLKQEKNPDSSYMKYTRRRATLRQVCRAWNQFILSTNSWWTHVRGPNDPQLTLDLPSITDQVPTIKRLSMTITAHECVGPGLNWASNLLQRVQAPLLSYNITLSIPYDPHFTHDPHDFFDAAGPKTALRSLRIACLGVNSRGIISFPQLNANFKNLVSLSLSNLVMRSTEELTLPRLELLHISSMYPTSAPPPTQAWNLPRLRHVYIAVIPSTTYFNTVLNFLRRYATQLESLFLIEYPLRNDIPHDFWDSFTALQLLGVRYHVLDHRSWSGWNITPPRSHPFRYLACRDCRDFEVTVASLRSLWTYHEEVALVIENAKSGEYYLIEGMKKQDWRASMTQTDGILPIRRPDNGQPPDALSSLLAFCGL